MSEVVKYHNNLNSLSFVGFKEKELDLFFTICFKLKEQGGNKIEIDLSELKRITELAKKPERLKKYVLELNKKLLSLNYQMKIAPNKYQAFVFFTTLNTDLDTEKLEVVVNAPFLYLLNDLVEKYTKFDLLEFVSLKSIYSKKMFKLLKQWDSLRNRDFKILEFRELLAIPEKHRMSDIDKIVLKPILEELPYFFKNLQVEKIKTGRKITNLKFTWEKDIKKIKEVEKVEVEIAESLNNLIEKAKKNRFLTEILTDKNIYKLTEMYEEFQLKKGLIYIYKAVKKDIPSFSYLIKILETGIEEQEVKIKVSKDKKEEVIEKLIEKEEIKPKREIVENPFYLMFLNMPEDVKKTIEEKAKKLFMEEVKINNMNPMYDKFYKASEKLYILKALGGE